MSWFENIDGSVFIEKHGVSRGPYYTLVVEHSDGSRDRLVNFGKQEPVFYAPDELEGLCETRLSHLPSESVDLIIDDPPYGTTQAEWDKEPDWDRLTEIYGRVLSETGTLIIFGKQPSLIPAYNAFTNDGFEFRFELIWKKQNNPWVSNQQPIPIHENIFVFKKTGVKVEELTFNTDSIKRRGVFVCPSCKSKNGSECPNCGTNVQVDPFLNRGPYNVSRTNEGKSETQGGWQEVYESEGGEERYPISYIDRDVLEFTSVVGAHEEYMGYAGQKPTDLVSWLVVAMSDFEDTVLDPHMGSGSTLIASTLLGRKSIGIEADQDRYKLAKNRIMSFLDELDSMSHASIAPTDIAGSENISLENAAQKYGVELDD